MEMIKPPIKPSKTMATSVQTAIRQSGGKVNRVNVASIPEAPAMKKASDVLSCAVEELGGFEDYASQEKSAGATWNAVKAAPGQVAQGVKNFAASKPSIGFRMSTPKMFQPSGHDPLWRYVPGVVGAAATYNAARNDGQGTLAAMGMGALGGATGAVLGNAAGKRYWAHTAPARQQAAYEAQKGIIAKQKYYDKLGGDANARARYVMDASKAKRNEPGIFNKAEGIWSTVKEYVGREANPGISDSDLLKRHFGAHVGQANELGKNMRTVGNEMRNENKHYYANTKKLQQYGVDIHGVNATLTQRGLDPKVVLNDPDAFHNRHFRDAVKGQGKEKDVYKYGWGGWAPWYTTR